MQGRHKRKAIIDANFEYKHGLSSKSKGNKVSIIANKVSIIAIHSKNIPTPKYSIAPTPHPQIPNLRSLLMTSPKPTKLIYD
jgi:hypothetical protein